MVFRLDPVEMGLFATIAVISVALTLVTCWRMYRIIARGQGGWHLDGLPQRLKTGVVTFLTQGRILRQRKVASIAHLFVAAGFTLYFLVNALDILVAFGWTGLRPTPVGPVYSLLVDVLSVLVLAAMAYFIARRFLWRDPSLQRRDAVLLHPEAKVGVDRDSLLVALFIIGHVGFRFLGETFVVAAEGGDAYQPFATFLGGAWATLSPPALELGWHVSFWIALGLIFLFLPYFPFTKHIHLFMGPLNLMLKPRRTSLVDLGTLDFEDETNERFGATHLFHLDRGLVLDAFACIQCGRCQDACPAYATGKELSPAAIEINKRYHIKANFAALAAGEDETPLAEYLLTDSALWACTACGACVDVCPVGCEPMRDILEVRRAKVLMEGEFPSEWVNAFNGMERAGNPWSVGEDRLAWTEPLDFKVHTVAEKPDFEVLYWVGCAGAFDPDGQRIARSIATVMKAAGVDFAVLGDLESCTGDSARRAGNEFMFDMLARANVENLDGIGAKERLIVTGCPHCLHCIDREYGSFGGDYTVKHHTEFFAELLAEGRIPLGPAQVEDVTFHDPCYLARHNGIEKAPRQTLEIVGLPLIEMERSGTNSFCCGAGGAQMWKEEEEGTGSVANARFAEALGTGARVLATGCPFCYRMIADANNAEDGPMQIKDVAMILAERLQG